MDSRGSIDTIGEISFTRTLTVANMTQRSILEQQLCLQLLSFSEITEALAERVLQLEERIAGLEQQLNDPENDIGIDDGLTELLSESESRVRKLKDLLDGPNVIPLSSTGAADQDGTEQDLPEAGPDGSGDETEYVDDPQIDLLSA